MLWGGNGKLMLAGVVVMTVVFNSLFCMFLLHSRLFDCDEQHASGVQLCSAGDIDRLKADAITAYRELYPCTSATAVAPRPKAEDDLNGPCARDLLAANGLIAQLKAQVTQLTYDLGHRPAQQHPSQQQLLAPVVCPACPTLPPPAPVPVTAPVTATGVVTGNAPYLLIGLPSVPRIPRGHGGGGPVDYLGPTLARLVEQMPTDPLHALYGRVQVVVMNNAEPGAHAVYDAAKLRYADNSNVVFVQNPKNVPDFAPPALSGPNSAPSDRVQKQTRDVVSLLRHVNGASAYYLFMEDDFAMCPHGLNVLSYVLAKAHAIDARWLSVKVGYGLNGLLLRNTKDGDLHAFGEYLLRHQRRRPPDHLATEWTAGESTEAGAYKAGRKHMAYRFNLMYHLGDVSAIRDGGQDKMPGCWHELRFPVLFEVDAFKKECDHDDMWPCAPFGTAESLTHPPFPLAPQVNAQPPYVQPNLPPQRPDWTHIPPALTR